MSLVCDYGRDLSVISIGAQSVLESGLSLQQRSDLFVVSTRIHSGAGGTAE